MNAAQCMSTIAAQFQQTVRSRGPQTAISIKSGGRYRSLTWNELAKEVFETAAVLRKLGVSRGDRVLQLSENRYEWIVTDLAVQFCCAVHVPVHAPMTAAQVAYQLHHSGASVAVASTEEQALKLAAIEPELMRGVQVVTHNEVDVAVDGEIPKKLRHLFASLNQQERTYIDAEDLGDIKAEAIATIIYTSGTTGEPKGVMLTQANLMSNTCSVTQVFGERPDDVRFSFLPFSHIFARTCDLYTWIFHGYQLALAENPDSVIANAQEIHPTLINGVPVFFERIKKYLDAEGLADQPGCLRAMLGGKICACGSGGAALPDDVFDFFVAQDVPLLQGYGLTETSPAVSVSSTSSVRRGTAGRPLPDVEVRIAGDGEILVRGPNVMQGYWKDPEATRAVLRDGWLHTGDLGAIDEDGFLSITGRQKELIVTATGKNVAPVLIESLLCRDAVIEQAIVIGNDRKYLTALIVPNLERLIDALHSQDQPSDTMETWDLGHPSVTGLVTQRVADQLRDLAPYEQVGCFRLIDKPFTIEAGHLTPKLTLRREVIERDYKDEIEALYR